VKKEIKHPIVAVATLYKKFDAPITKAWGVFIEILAEDGLVDKTQPRLFIPMGQLKELIEGKYSDAQVQQYEAFKPKLVNKK
jgi:hypothetical protein